MQGLLDWGSWQTAHYLTAAGLVAAFLSLLLHLTGGSGLKVPAIIGSSLGCLVGGVGIGLLTMMAFGYHWQTETEAEAARAPAGPPRGGMGPPGGGGGGGGGGNAKTRLATLVAKLDILTDKPLAIHLDAEQKKKLRQQLGELEGKDQLSGEEAEKALREIEATVKDHADTLRAAGYRFPGGPNPPRLPPPTAPFNYLKAPPYAEHTRSLLKRLDRNN